MENQKNSPANWRTDRRNKTHTQMRIGIHSGPVMAGIVGIRVPRYSLFGNTTTLANQLETHGVGGKIHISDFTLK